MLAVCKHIISMRLETEINPLLVRVCVRIYKSILGGFALNALLLLALRPFASTRCFRRRLGSGSYIFSLVNDGTVGGSIRIASSSTSISNAMFLTSPMPFLVLP